MSEGIDQNGDISDGVKEPLATVEVGTGSGQAPSDRPAQTSALETAMDDTSSLADTDTSMDHKDPLDQPESQSVADTQEDQEAREIVNKSTVEHEDTVAKIEQEEALNQSRELKSLLALSKEAKLDTNISRKRKVLNLRKKVRSEGKFSPGKVSRIQYPVTAESELEMELHSGDSNKMDVQEDESSSVASHLKAVKRKKSLLSDASGESVVDDSPKRSRKSFSYEIAAFKPNKDMFCWRCHKDIVNISCETCPRSYHQKCLKQTITDLDHWPCPECVSILKAESTQSRSPAMRGMTLEHLCSLLKFAVNRMIQCQGSEPFIHAVSDNEFPDYKKYIIQPMDLTQLEKNIKENLYGSTQAFEADAKWILHNSIIFNSYQSKLTSVAKSIIKICKQEMSEIENCPSCYLNANTKKKTWFVEVCPKPHLLVWAKLRGFPFWPGKAMSCKDGMVDVRFFGAHDRAWVPEKECFLYSPKDPNLFRVKRADIEQCVEELLVHVENLKKVYLEFNYPPFKTPMDPDNELKQLQMFLPRYKSYFSKKTQKGQSFDKDKDDQNENLDVTEPEEQTNKESKLEEKANKKKSKNLNADDEGMEGYGTDDESVPEIDTELRRNLLKKSKNHSEKDSQEADEDDTQVPTNVEPDTSGIEEVVVIRGRIKSFSGDSKLGRKKSDSEPTSKRSSFDDTTPLSVKIRRNSDTKTDPPRISDRISKVVIADDVEISLGNDDKGLVSCSSSNSECSSDFNVEIKKKPVQVDVDNVEFTISPASKLKMSDKLMKRLSDGESGEEGRSGKVADAKRNLNDQAPVLSAQPSDPDPVSSTGAADEEIRPQDCSDKKVDPEVSCKLEEESSKKSDKIPVEDDSSSDSTKDHKTKDRDKVTEAPNKDTPEKVNWTVEETSPNSGSPKIILKAVRSEDKLDNLVNKDADEEKAKSLEEPMGSSGPAESCIEKSDDNRTSIAQESSPKKASTPENIVEKSIPNESAPSSDKEEALKEPQADDTDASDPKQTDQDLPDKKLGETAEKSAVAQTHPEHNLAIDINIDKTNIMNIIHSSLNDSKTPSTKPPAMQESTTPKPKPESRKTSKRKKSIDFDESVLETQNKVLKLVSIESIMNKANNNQGEGEGKNDSILKTSLQQPKPSAKPTSHENSPSNSARNSIHEMSPDEIKSEPESEAESGSVRDLEAKKKYLSALNILEKGEADAQKPKSNEIRTRSKTEEKRERFRVSNEPQIVDNMTKIIEDVAVNYSAVHEGDSLLIGKNKVAVPSAAKADGGEIFVKSFAKIGSDSPEVRAAIIPLPSSKQRARKSFPHPNYNKPVFKPSPPPLVSKEHPHVATSAALVIQTTEAIPRLTARTPITTPSTSTSLVPALTSTQASKSTGVPPLQQLEAMRPANGYLILQSQQQENLVFLPPNQTISYSSPISSQVMSMTPCLVSAPTNTATVRHLSQPQIWQSNPNSGERQSLAESQNYIPQGEKPKNTPSQNSGARSAVTSRKLVNGLPEPGLVTSTLETSNNVTSSTAGTSNSADRPTESASTTSSSESPQPVEPVLVAENGEADEFCILNSLVPETVTRAVSEIIRRPPPKLKPRPPGVLSQQFSEGQPSSAGPVTARINSVAHRLGDYFRGMLIETLEDLGKTTNAEATISTLKLEIETLKHKHTIEISEIEKNMCTVLKDIQRSIVDDRERVIEETRAACEAETIKRVEEAKSKQWCANCSKEAQFYCCWNTSYCDYPCQQKHWPTHVNKCTQNVNQPAQITPSSTIRPGGQQLILRPANPPPKGGIGRVFTKPLQKVYMNRNASTPKTMRVQTSAGNLLTMMETTPGNYQLVTTSSLIRTGSSLTSIKPAGLASPASINTITGPKSGNSKQPLRVLGHSIPVTTILEEESD